MNIQLARSARGLREVDPASWDALLAERGLRDIYFLRDYVEASCFIDTGQPAYLHVSGEKGDVVFACIVRDDPADVTTPYGYGGPVPLGPEAPVERFWQLYEAWCRERGVVTTFLRFHPLLGNQREARLHVERLGRTVVWRLDPTIHLGSAMDKHHRRVIRRAEREGLEAHIEERPGSLNEFVALYEHTMRRNRAADFYLFPAAYWRAVHGSLGRCLVRVDVRRGVELHASLLMFATWPWLHYHLGASSDEGRRIGASHLALFAVARWGQERGYERLHLGGGVAGREDSLFEFKRRFFPSGLAEAAIGKAVHDTARYRRLSGSDPAALNGYFPAYRDPTRRRQAASPVTLAAHVPGEPARWDREGTR
jgi:serine/alanine adding enzyme